MGIVIVLDDYRPHNNARMECSSCEHQWIATYPTTCIELECPGCGTMVRVNE